MWRIEIDAPRPGLFERLPHSLDMTAGGEGEEGPAQVCLGRLDLILLSLVNTFCTGHLGGLWMG